MTYDEMTACATFQTILKSYAPPTTPAQHTQLNGYLSLIFAATQNWKLSTFERACTGVIKTMGRGQKPMPEDFGKALNENRGENLPGDPGCNSCKQTGFVYVSMLETATGRTGDFVTPCPSCRHQHPYKDARPRTGWVIMDHKQEPHLTRMARTLGPAGAQYVIDRIDKEKLRFPEEVTNVLVATALKADSPSAVAVVDPKPVESDTADVAFPEVPPNVRDIPLSERERLDMEAQQEDIPF